MTSYDQAGLTYAHTRRTDTRIAAQIRRALGDSTSVANIGAGAGSYESSQTVVAVEPSSVMIAQRGPLAAAVVRAEAEHLPIRTDSVDAALAVLTVHHWTDLERGLAEMLRIARRRIVVFTWDHTVFRQFWLVRDYLPAAAATDARLAVPLHRFTELLGADGVASVSVEPVPVPHDCADGFAAAYWRRPWAYLDPTVQAGMSVLARTAPSRRRAGLARLRTDVENGSWAARYASLLNATTIDGGYRLVIVELR